MDDLKIYPVKDEEQIMRGGKILNPILPKPAAQLLLIAPVKTGKSTIISNLLLRDSMYKGYFTGGTHFISPTINLDKTSRYIRDHPDINTYDEYSDELMDAIIDFQREREDDLPVCIVLDDILGVIKQGSVATKFSSRYRHHGVDLLVWSIQKYTQDLPPVIRMNATDVIIGSPFPNQKELGKIFEEFGDMYMGEDNLRKLYDEATPNKHDFLYLKLSENPPEAFSNFEKQIYPKKQVVAKDMDIKEIRTEDDVEEDKVKEGLKQIKKNEDKLVRRRRNRKSN
tara:strand:+ start:17961 stop:18809 length:849 start_codon:yes stop_codon:yes gene_type:complete